MSTIAKAAKADFEIVANLVRDNNGQHAVPKLPPIMNFGKTVHYSSPDGEVRIEFRDKNGSPFLDLNGNVKTVITSNEPPITFSKSRTFTCRCFITPPGRNAAAIGWLPGDPLSGG